MGNVHWLVFWGVSDAHGLVFWRVVDVHEHYAYFVHHPGNWSCLYRYGRRLHKGEKSFPGKVKQKIINDETWNSDSWGPHLVLPFLLHAPLPRSGLPDWHHGGWQDLGIIELNFQFFSSGCPLHFVWPAELEKCEETNPCCHHCCFLLLVHFSRKHSFFCTITQGCLFVQKT